MKLSTWLFFILHVDAKHFLRSFIRFLRSFISPPRGECCMPTWRIRNFQVGVAEFLRRDRKAPLGTIRAKRGTICGTRIYYRVSTIRVTLCRNARLVSSEMASVPVKGYCVIALTQRTHRSCVPTQGYSSRFDTTDAQTERPYRATYRCSTTDARAVRPYNRYSSRESPRVARS